MYNGDWKWYSNINLQIVCRTFLPTGRCLALTSRYLGSKDAWLTWCEMKLVPDVQKLEKFRTQAKPPSSDYFGFQRPVVGFTISSNASTKRHLLLQPNFKWIYEPLNSNNPNQSLAVLPISVSESHSDCLGSSISTSYSAQVTSSGHCIHSASFLTIVDFTQSSVRWHFAGF